MATPSDEAPTKNTEPWQDPLRSPHAMQAVINRDAFPYERVINPALRRVLPADSPTEPYESQPEYVKTVVHWGQRKLLLSEIEFLTLIGRNDLRGATVVYAGAGPGTHIPQLTRMFPQVHFILVDPTPFTRELREMEERPDSRVLLMNRLFTDELASELAQKYGRILFVSDIRVEAYDEDPIEKDMAAQMRWHELLGATRSMLKFRLPWTKPGSTEYLDGDIYLPVWGPQTTTESRLITKKGAPLARRTYHHDLYNNQMFYFRCYLRPALYPHQVQGVPGLDHCYDCSAEVAILSHYLSEFTLPTRGAGAASQRVAQLSNEITRAIPGGRTLRDETRLFNHPSRACRKRTREASPENGEQGLVFTCETTHMV